MIRTSSESDQSCGPLTGEWAAFKIDLPWWLVTLMGCCGTLKAFNIILTGLWGVALAYTVLTPQKCKTNQWGFVFFGFLFHCEGLLTLSLATGPQVVWRLFSKNSFEVTYTVIFQSHGNSLRIHIYIHLYKGIHIQSHAFPPVIFCPNQRLRRRRRTSTP